MKEIRKFEEVISNPDKKGKSYKELGINRTMFLAYKHSKEAENELIDFNEVIWDYDIEGIVDNLKAEDIKEFTISCTFSTLLSTPAEFEKFGVFMNGLTTVNTGYTDWNTGEKEKIPAIRMIVR